MRVSTALKCLLAAFDARGPMGPHEAEARRVLGEHLLVVEEGEADEEKCFGSNDDDDPRDGSGVHDDNPQTEPDPLDGIRAAYNALPLAEKEAVRAKLREMYPDHPAWKKGE